MFRCARPTTVGFGAPDTAPSLQPLLTLTLSLSLFLGGSAAPVARRAHADPPIPAETACDDGSFAPDTTKYYTFRHDDGDAGSIFWSAELNPDGTKWKRGIGNNVNKRGTAKQSTPGAKVRLELDGGHAKAQWRFVPVDPNPNDVDATPQWEVRNRHTGLKLTVLGADDEYRLATSTVGTPFIPRCNKNGKVVMDYVVHFPTEWVYDILDVLNWPADGLVRCEPSSSHDGCDAGETLRAQPRGIRETYIDDECVTHFEALPRCRSGWTRYDSKACGFMSLGKKSKCERYLIKTDSSSYASQRTTKGWHVEVATVYAPRDELDAPALGFAQQNPLQAYGNVVATALVAGASIGVTALAGKLPGAVVKMALTAAFVDGGDDVTDQLNELAAQVREYVDFVVLDAIADYSVFELGLEAMDGVRFEYMSTYQTGKGAAMAKPMGSTARRDALTALTEDAINLAGAYSDANYHFKGSIVSQASLQINQKGFNLLKVGVAETMQVYREAIILEVYNGCGFDPNDPSNAGVECSCEGVIADNNLENILQNERSKLEQAHGDLFENRDPVFAREIDEIEITHAPAANGGGGGYSRYYTVVVTETWGVDTAHEAGVYSWAAPKDNHNEAQTAKKGEAYDVQKLLRDEVRFDMNNWSYSWDNSATKAFLDSYLDDTLLLCSAVMTDDNTRAAFEAQLN